MRGRRTNLVLQKKNDCMIDASRWNIDYLLEIGVRGERSLKLIGNRLQTLGMYVCMMGKGEFSSLLGPGATCSRAVPWRAVHQTWQMKVAPGVRGHHLLHLRVSLPVAREGRGALPARRRRSMTDDQLWSAKQKKKHSGGLIR